MAVNFYVEFRGAKADEKTVVDKVKALWRYVLLRYKQR